MEIMNARSIRHLPVKDSEGRVLGLISIRDVVKEVISTKEVCLRTTHLSRVVKVGQRTKEAQAQAKPCVDPSHRTTRDSASLHTPLQAVIRATWEFATGQRDPARVQEKRKKKKKEGEAEDPNKAKKPWHWFNY
jgi:hypothetical protein